MADIAIDTEVTSQAANAFAQVATMLEELIGRVRTAHQNTMVEGKGRWTTSFTTDTETLLTELQRVKEASAEIGRDLQATVQGFLDGDTSAAGYFGK